MATNNCDRSMMSMALRLAAKGIYTTTPNPMVGCVITQGDEIVGRGWHVRAGLAHAEVVALAEAGERALGATAYVTLEPCAHRGRTGPCVDALLQAGVQRVVAASEDPNPKVAGAGIAALRAAGVVVDVGLLEQQARDLNCGFFKRHEYGVPWVTIKTAASLDGRTAMASGQSQWITAPPARRDVQRMRAQNCAIITGIGTQQMDDPSLTLRISYADLGLSVDDVDSSLRQPLRVVVDSQCQMSSGARLLQQDGATLIATTDGALQRQRAAALESAGAEVIFLPAREQRVDLQSLLQHLAERGCNRVMVEAGAGLAGAFVGEGLLDEMVCYWAPKLFGSHARPMFDLPIETIDAHLALSVVDMSRIGEDIRLTLQPEKDY